MGGGLGGNLFVLLDGGSSIAKKIYELKLHTRPVDSIQTIKLLHYGLKFFSQCSQFVSQSVRSLCTCLTFRFQ